VKKRCEDASHSKRTSSETI